MLCILTTIFLLGFTHGGLPGIEEDPRASPQMGTDLDFFDMKLTAKQKQHVDKGDDVGVSDNALAASNKAFHKWPNAIIPYEIDCSLENMPTALESIRLAQEEWESKTCIRFVKRTNEKDYLRFFRDTHCWGHVGRIGGRSSISVGHGCDYQHVMTHEIGHVVGFWHEQNRMDRDDWVQVFWENISEWVKSAFRKVTDSDSLGVQYDYASIMHYPWNAFSNNGKDTMRPKRPVNIQPYQYLSDLDAKQTSLMYNCPAILKQREQEAQLNYDAAQSGSGVTEPQMSRVEACTFYCLTCADLVDSFPVGCVDKHPSCASWEKAGYCQSNSYTRKNCQKSCKDPSCDPTIPCEDKYAKCSIWAKWGHCKLNPTVNKYCVKSCADRCKTSTPKPPQTLPPTQPPTQPPSQPPSQPPTQGPTKKPQPTQKPKETKLGIGILCRDRHTRCPEWASWGECKRNPGYMLKNCKLSCNQTDCDRGIQKPPGTCADPLGLSWDGKGLDFKIPDTAITATSALSPGGGWAAAGQNARLYFEDDYDNKRIGAWCVGSWKQFQGSYVQVDLQQRKTIRYIATQGRDKYFERVGKYKVGYSNNGGDFTFYRENGKDKVFNGNCDHFTPILNQFKNPINARFIRVYPTEANYPCMRMELYGC